MHIVVEIEVVNGIETIRPFCAQSALFAGMVGGQLTHDALAWIQRLGYDIQQRTTVVLLGDPKPQEEPNAQ